MASHGQITHPERASECRSSTLSGVAGLMGPEPARSASPRSGLGLEAGEEAGDAGGDYDWRGAVEVDGFDRDEAREEQRALGSPLAGFADPIAKLAEVVRISGDRRR